jgi:hypothetical protein
MANAGVAEKLPGADELDELYRLDASESEPEDDDGDDEEADDGDDEEADDGDDDDGEFEPGEVPHP